MLYYFQSGIIEGNKLPGQAIAVKLIDASRDNKTAEMLVKISKRFRAVTGLAAYGT